MLALILLFAGQFSAAVELTGSPAGLATLAATTTAALLLGLLSQSAPRRLQVRSSRPPYGSAAS